MGKLAQKTYRLLDGEAIDLGDLSPQEAAFLADLRKMAREGVSYFEIYRTALGPGSLALNGRSRVDRRLAETPLYRAAEDMATRSGIEQGLILAPRHEALRITAPTDASMMSVTQAADLIGVSRAAVYKAIERGALGALHVGNVTLVDRAAAAEYRDHREAEIERPRARGRSSATRAGSRSARQA